MLQNTIEKKRKKMINAAKHYGMTSKETVKCSQELDKLICNVIAESLKKHSYIKSV